MNDPVNSSPSPLGAEGYTDLIRSLLAELSAAGITEAEIGYGTLRVMLRRRPGVAPPAPAPLPTAVAPAERPEREHWTAVTAPLSGMFYNRPAPEADPFVHVGGLVHPGQTIGLIESMKMFNDVACEVQGIVREILAANGEVVHAQQVLLYVELTDEAPASPVITAS